MSKSDNYDLILSSISNIKDDYDKVLLELRDLDNRQRNNSIGWIFKPLVRGLLNYTPFFPSNSNSLITKVTSSSILQHMGLVAFITGSINQFNNLTNTLLLIATVLFYCISVVVNFKREITVFDEYFDISAFRSLEKLIHTKLVSKYIESAPFTFGLLYDYIKDLLHNSSKHLQEVYSDLQDKEKKLQLLQTELEKSKLHVGEMSKSLKYQIGLQSHLNKTILRIIDGNFNKEDLHLVCNFSLFREEGNILTLDASHGLTRTPSNLKLDNLTESQKDWAVIRAYLDEEEGIYEDISHNRKIVSQRFRMVDNTIYVYSYHYDSHRDEDYGIIKTQEASKTIYTLISYWHSECIAKEDVRDERSKGN
ncbi:hypothetical protein ACGTN9_17520 [Halobacillus sp. MO56]